MTQNIVIISFDTSELDDIVFDDEAFCHDNEYTIIMSENSLYKSVNLDDFVLQNFNLSTNFPNDLILLIL